MINSKHFHTHTREIPNADSFEKRFDRFILSVSDTMKTLADKIADERTLLIEEKAALIKARKMLKLLLENRGTEATAEDHVDSHIKSEIDKQAAQLQHKIERTGEIIRGLARSINSSVKTYTALKAGYDAVEREGGV